jgi:large subunit ribosomal protein L15
VNICDINKSVKAHKKVRRVGRGESSGQGKTAGRGHKGVGQKSPTSMLRTEGGQMQIFRRLPKRGFNNSIFRKEYGPVNLDTLETLFNAGDTVSPETLREKGIHKSMELIKVLGRGELTKALTVKIHAVSATAKEKIEKAGGSVEVIAVAAAKSAE